MHFMFEALLEICSYLFDALYERTKRIYGKKHAIGAALFVLAACGLIGYAIWILID